MIESTTAAIYILAGHEKMPHPPGGLAKKENEKPFLTKSFSMHQINKKLG